MDPFKSLPEGYKTSKDDLVKLEDALKDKRKNTITMEEPKMVQRIVDLDDLMDRIIVFLEYLEKPEIKEMQNDERAFPAHMMEKFVENFDKYFQIFTKLLEVKNRSANVKSLLDLIDRLNKVKSGEKNEDYEFEKFREEKAQDLIYPKFGGKDAYIRAMQKENKK